MSADIQTPYFTGHFRENEVSISDRESGTLVVTLNAQSAREVEAIIQQWRVRTRHGMTGGERRNDR